MKHTITILNLKCGGCASTVKKELTKMGGITAIDVNVDEATVTFESDAEDPSEVIERLDQIGYPADESSNTLLKKAKSYVSCAVGRMNAETEEK